ncbi:M14 family zinc carboxypeptidase [Pseudoalteromonas byunsanensis]|uniref:carboxypeptidase T n=1 Tax=Pseudoalteromonas byunsanensis TaxID=327939 RepID=A0A1S1N694_9GAMM|nr:M14 family zinc carboxypeptidase [Pseudoalteromonas byunsanensis]OHU94977.1 hypothetical protein BIW53_13250 [Pseudoalteromonas byunsanensis]
MKLTSAMMLLALSITTSYATTQSNSKLPSNSDNTINTLKTYRILANSEQHSYQLAHEYHDALIDRQNSVVTLLLENHDVDELRERGYFVLPVEAKHALKNQPHLKQALQQETTAKTAQSIKVSSLNSQTGIPGFQCYPSVEETYQQAQDIATRYPHLASWQPIGSSWEKTQGLGGYDLNVLVLGKNNKKRKKPKPVVFMQSAIHAREYTTAATTLAFAQYLVDNYQNNTDVQWILQERDIHILFVANPDGRKQAETGLLWRKNTNDNYCADTPQRRGVDLNRNFSYEWFAIDNGSSGDQCASTYRGPVAASEPEVQAIERYVRSLFEDRRGDLPSDAAPLDTQGVFLDIHSAGGMILYPYDTTDEAAPNEPQLKQLAQRFAAFTGYRAIPGVQLYPADGTTMGLGYSELGVASFAFELGRTFFESCQSYQQEVLPNNLQALLYAAKIADAPYITPQGPEVLDLRISGAGSMAVPQGSELTLQARVSDEFLLAPDDGQIEPGQAIKKVRLRVKRHGRKFGRKVKLKPVDGVFDSPEEFISHSLNTRYWPNGKYTLIVQAQDRDGNWGVKATQQLTLDSSAPTPVAAPQADFITECEYGSCTLTATPESTPKEQLTYKWFIDNEDVPLHGPTVQFLGLKGTYTVKLEVENNYAQRNSTEKSFEMDGPVLPIVNVSYECEKLRCRFDASKSYDPDGSVAFYGWRINGEYVRSDEAVLEYEFDQAGEQKVEVIAVDNEYYFGLKVLYISVTD